MQRKEADEFHPFRACAQLKRPDLTFFFAFDVVRLDKHFIN